MKRENFTRGYETPEISIMNLFSEAVFCTSAENDKADEDYEDYYLGEV